MSVYICMDPETEEIFYVGSTIKTLRERMACHHSKMNGKKPTSFHKWILENDMWKKNKLFIIEDSPPGGYVQRGVDGRAPET